MINVKSSSISSILFYVYINDLLDNFQKRPNENILKCIYQLIKLHLDQVDVSTELNHLKDLQIKLVEAKVSEKTKVLKLVNAALSPIKKQGSKRDLIAAIDKMVKMIGGKDAEKGVNTRSIPCEESLPKGIWAEHKQSISWVETLPKEIYKEIFSYLDSDELSKIPTLNKTFHQMVQEPTIQGLMIEKADRILNFNQLNAIVAQYGDVVRNLNLENLEDLTDKQLLSLVQACPHLQTLNVSGTKISEKGLKFLTELRELKNLNLSECGHIRDEGIQLISQMNTLETLDLSSCPNITDKSLELIGEMKSLKSFNIKHNQRFTEEGFKSIAHLSNLKFLNLSDTQITDKGLKWIAQLQKLQSLNLKDTKITTEGLKEIVQLHHIQMLNLGKNKKFTGNENLFLISKLQNLLVLDLSQCQDLNDEALKWISQLPKLQKLNLSHCTKITDNGLQFLAQLIKLDELDLAGCSEITDNGLESISQLSNLLELNLSGCIEITDKGLNTLTLLTNLQKLNLFGCLKISENGFGFMLIRQKS